MLGLKTWIVAYIVPGFLLIAWLAMFLIGAMGLLYGGYLSAFIVIFVV